MGYIITATFATDLEVNNNQGTMLLLAESRIRLLSKDDEAQTVVLDIRGDYDTKQEDTRWLCNKLINAGILSFEIEHSY